MSACLRTLVASLCLCFTCLPAKAKDPPDYTTALPPFQIADNLYYVGSRDLAAYLITTPAGNILINANLKSSAPLIRASVEKFGFSWKDTKILLNGQAHADHMGGAAEVLRQTHARDMVMDADADAVRSGGRPSLAVCGRFRSTASSMHRGSQPPTQESKRTSTKHSLLCTHSLATYFLEPMGSISIYFQR